MVFNNFENVWSGLRQFLKSCNIRWWYPVVPPLHLPKKKLKLSYPVLRAERHCFDQRNGFQQFLERLKQLNAISEILKKIVDVSPLNLTKKNWNCHTQFLWVERHCFDQRNGFQQFLERLKQFKSISEILQNSLVVSCGPPFALDKKIEIVIPSFYESKNIVLIKKWFSTILRTFEAV